MYRKGLRLFTLICGICLLCTSCVGRHSSSDITTGCDDTQEAPPAAFPDGMNGITLSVSDAIAGGLERETVATVLHSMCVRTVCCRIDMSTLFCSDGTANEEAIGQTRAWLDAVTPEGGNLIVSVSGGLWKPMYRVTDPDAIPYPDYDEGSLYLEYLEQYRTCWTTLANAFPQVKLWQIGGALNLDSDSHPVTYATKGAVFNAEEKAQIIVDRVQTARNAVRSINENALMILPAIEAGKKGTDAIIDALGQIYNVIESGKTGSGETDPDAYFDRLSWVPDLCWYSFSSDLFVKDNDRIRAVAVSHGDAEKRVVLTGYGFADFGSSVYDSQQSVWLKEIAAETAEKLPYVDSLCPSELLEAENGTKEETSTRGMFRVFDSGSFGAKEKAKALCSLYGGVVGQLDMSIGSNLVYPEPDSGKNLRNGIGFAIKGADERGLDINKIMDLMQTMNIGAMRNWMNIRTMLTSPTELNQSEVAKQKQWLAQLNVRGITKIIGMSQNGFWPGGGVEDVLAVPVRDLTDGSLYRQYLDLYEQSWYTLASAFPEIRYWETGNETNSDNILHPVDYQTHQKKFTAQEKAEITADMMFVAARAVHRANPDAVVIFPAIAPVNGFESMAEFLERVYGVIENGSSIGGTSADAYFDAMSWHCYYFKTTFTPENWLNGNNLVYGVMQKHGDGDKKVFLTEFGFSDFGSEEKDALQATYFEEIYKLADSMPYLDSFYPFRMIEDETAAEWGGTIEIYYGMFRVFGKDGFAPKEKAKTLCQIYGGNISELDRFSNGNSVYPR